jgi:hypothetical protein
MANNGRIGIVQYLKMKEGRKYAIGENESFLSE